MDTDGIIKMIIAMVIIIGIFCLAVSLQHDVDELGQAICEEEYDMDYKGYNGKILSCEPMKEKEHYDGVQINIIH